MNLFESLRVQPQEGDLRSLAQLVTEAFSFNGYGYQFLGGTLSQTSDEERISPAFSTLVEQAYRSNGVVFAVQMVRTMLFSEARFKFRRFVEGRPGELFGSEALRLLERPWPGATTGDLLTRAIQDADIAGNFFAVRRPTDPPRLRRLRPDWVSIVLGSDRNDVPFGGVVEGVDDAEVVGYLYHPGGHHSGNEPISFDVSDVMHFAPTPDPLASYRGMSWLTPVIREIKSDLAATNHKSRFFSQGATPNMIVQMDAPDPETFKSWINLFREQNEGMHNAYRTMFLTSAADPTVVGADFQQMDFKVVQGAGETRIAAAGGVPPVIVGLSEGLAASTYSNYSQARRRLSDGTMRPLWRNFAGSAEVVVDVPNGAELWYDDRDIPFLSEDAKDLAEIRGKDASTIRTLVDGGFKPDNVVEAVTSGDLRRLLGQHTNLLPVQLQPPVQDVPVADFPGDEDD